VLNLAHDDVKAIVERALEETSEVFQAMSVPMDHLRLRRQTADALIQVDNEEPEVTGVIPETEPETLVSLLRDVVQKPTNDLRATTLMVMEAIYRGGPFDHVLFAMLDDTGHRLAGKIGFGESIDKIVASFHFPVIGASGPVAEAVLKQADVFVAGPRDRRYEGTRFRQIFSDPVFGLFPLLAGGAVVGCLYFDRREPKAFDNAAMAALAALRDQLSRALTESRILTTTGNGR
jgi:hypothetical protein